ncbi:XRE family transcriptional regulator [Algimonas porphyrae]|uniref:Cro/Cl family transcriptional regulator n=1 Tax=Algimonas porphyrae TaxID=1128113 RepID=A0ABQ5V2K1_9PROT|nr:S24 family peptidase [Algimonas porphyrae]GLQ20467.1 Cro/Cl family transcriptional regulator [Algimonas porphyrae]
MGESLKSVADRLKSVIPEGVTQDQFADELGYPVSSFKRWLSGSQDLKASIVAKIAKETGSDLNWILNGVPSVDVAGGELVLIRRFDIEASAGAGAVINGEPQIAPVAFERDWFQEHVGLSTENLSVITSRGDSMFPTIRPGALLIVDHGIEEFHGDEIYAFTIDGDLYVKRIQKILGGGLLIQSDNEAYIDQEIESPESVNMKLIGIIKFIGNWV